MNHSCAPNIDERMHERERSGYALRDIVAGEELTVDYDRIAYLESPFVCHCSHAVCRGVIRGKHFL